MKPLNFVSLIFCLVSSHALAVEYDSPYTASVLSGTKPGECQTDNPVLNQSIISAMDSHHYEIAVIYQGQVVSRGALETTQTTFSSPGRYRLPVKYLGMKVVPLENGFTAKIGLWQECSK